MYQLVMGRLFPFLLIGIVLSAIVHIWEHNQERKLRAGNLAAAEVADVQFRKRQQQLSSQTMRQAQEDKVTEVVAIRRGSEMEYKRVTPEQRAAELERQRKR